MSLLRDDPAAEEERLQAEWDKYISALPKCSICERPIHRGRRRYRTSIGKIEITFCEDCFEELKESGEIYCDE